MDRAKTAHLISTFSASENIIPALLSKGFFWVKKLIKILVSTKILFLSNSLIFGTARNPANFS